MHFKWLTLGYFNSFFIFETIHRELPAKIVYNFFMIGKYGSDDIENFIKESLHMKALNHPNVMRLVGLCFDAGTAPYIVLPFMAG